MRVTFLYMWLLGGLAWCDINSGGKSRKTWQAYDCRHPDAKVQALSGIQVGTCPSPDPISTPNATHDIQVIQKARYTSTPFISCFIIRTLTIFQCNTIVDFINVVPRPYRREIKQVTPTTCAEIHKYKTYEISSGSKIDALKPNSTTSGSVTLAGSTNTAGDCQGGDYTTGGTSYYRVVVEAEYEITITDGVANIDLQADKINFPNGLSCKYSAGTCDDLSLGTISWSYSAQSCSSTDMIVLYEGPATFLQVQQGVQIEDLASLVVSTVSQSFAFTTLENTILCGTILRKTEHNQIFVYKISGTSPFRSTGEWNIRNVDFQAYTDSKFAYVDRNYKENIITLHRALSAEKCRIERMALQNLISLAYISPDLFAYAYKEAPGFTALVRGEVIYIIECVAVAVEGRDESQFCYSEMPVRYQEKDMFVTPRNHILTNAGTPVDCSGIFPTKFQLHSLWMSMYPTRTMTNSPHILSPRLSTSFTYNDLPVISSIGLYSVEQIKRYQSQLVFHAEREAIATNIAHRYIGSDVDPSVGTIKNLFDGDELPNMLRSYWSWIFGVSTSIGTWIAFLIGVTAIFRLFIGLLNVIVNVRLLYKTVGLSWKMLASVAESLVHMVLLNETKNADAREHTKTTGPADGTNEDTPQPRPRKTFRSCLTPWSKTITPTAPESYPLNPTPNPMYPDLGPVPVSVAYVASDDRPV